MANTNGGGGGFEHFVDSLGRWINVPLISEVKAPPSKFMYWTTHARGTSQETDREDHDPELVLPNITAQTGLEFEKQTRKVTVLFVEELAPAKP